MNLVWNSLVTASVATALATLFGLAVALFATGLARPWRSFITALAAISLAIPPFVVTNCWLHYLGQTGVWHGWLPLNIFSLGGTTWVLSLLTWPLIYFFVSAAWQSLDPALLESDLQLCGRKLLRLLLLPIARTALIEGALLAFILCLNNFAVPAILQVKVAPAEAWIRFNTEFDTVGAIKASWLNILLPVVVLFWFSGRVVSWPRQNNLQPQLVRIQLGKLIFPLALALAVLVLILSAGLPIFQLLSVKRTWTELPGALAAGTAAIKNSVVYSAGAATLLMLVILGWRALRSSKPSSRPSVRTRTLTAASWVPFLVPGVVLGIALIACFNRDWSSAFYQGSGIVLTAFALRYLGPGCFAVNRACEAIDPALTEAALMEGANKFRVLQHAIWPQVAGRLAAAWYVIFLLCVWDVESLVLVVPPGGETLSLRIFNFLHYGHNAQVNALCFALLLLALCPLLLGMLVGWLKGRKPFGMRSQFTTVTFLVLLSTSGCGRHYAENEAPLQSAMFGSVQIIGTRGVGVGQFNKPRSVAVDEQDNLYVADMTGRIQKFSPDGKFLLSWQMPQTDLGKPKGMTRDLAGNIVVLEPHYQRVNHFSPEGKLVAQWGHKGTNAGEFMLPRGVAIDSHNEAFVGEYSSMERVQKFQLASKLTKTSPPQTETAVRESGKLLLGFGRPGNAPGEFNRPEGLFVDKSDQLFVADSCNHRIQVFARDGAFLRAYGKAGSGPGEFSYPYDICLDPQGNQYVCEFGNSRIQILDPANKTIEIIGKAGSAPGEFSNPWGVALDSHGNLYVADSQNHRVQKLIRRHPTLVAATQPSTPNPQLRSFNSPL